MKVAPFLPLALALVLPVGCDKPEPAADQPAPAAAPSASAASATAAVPSSPPAAAQTAAPTASAPPASSAPIKDAVVSVLDPVKEPARTVKVLAGGSVALYLPQWAGTTWKVAQPDATLGKPKEETIPGFAGPTTPAHALTWQIKDTLKGQTHKVSLSNGTKGQPPGPVFTLTIDVN